MSETAQISAAFPFESKFVDVLGSKMHYIDEGTGDITCVFLHGIPTSSYLWRNIVPQLTDKVRCVALDLIGMGQSDKPPIKYTVFDHIKYFEAFMDALSLSNVVLVCHAWGSVIGGCYASKHSAKIAGLAFLEAYLRPPTSDEMISLPIQEMAALGDLPDRGYDVVMNSNYFVNRVLPAGVLRELSDEEMAHYRAPFEKEGSCLPLWQYLQDLPCSSKETPVTHLMADYSNYLQQSPLPKLLMYAVPGFNTTISTVAWAKEHLANLEVVDVDEGLHYPQESEPEVIGKVLREWLLSKISD